MHFRQIVCAETFVLACYLLALQRIFFLLFEQQLAAISISPRELSVSFVVGVETSYQSDA